MTDLDLDALEKRYAESMPGYWSVRDNPIAYDGVRVLAGSAPGEPLGGAEWVTRGHTWRAQDAAWIADAHNAFPALIAAARSIPQWEGAVARVGAHAVKAEAERDAAQAELAKARDTIEAMDIFRIEREEFEQENATLLAQRKVLVALIEDEVPANRLPVEVHNIAVWTHEDTQVPSLPDAKAQDILRRIRSLHNADGVRWVGFPRAAFQQVYCTGCGESAPCTTVRIFEENA